MAVGDAHVFPGFLTPALTQLFFLSKSPTTSLTCFFRGERRKYTGKEVCSTRDRNHNHQVMSPTRSPLSHPGGAYIGVGLSVCSIFLSALDHSYYWTYFVQTSHVDCKYSEDVNIIFWSLFIEFYSVTRRHFFFFGKWLWRVC